MVMAMDLQWEAEALLVCQRFGEITNFVLDLQSQTEGAPIWGDACTCWRMMLWLCKSKGMMLLCDSKGKKE